MLGNPLVAASVVSKGAETYNKLPKKQKQGINIVGGLIALGAAYTGYKMFSNMTDLFKSITGQKAEEDRQKQEVINKNNIMNELESQSQRPTLSKTEIQNVASNLFRAFDGMGTDEKRINANLLRLKNKSDWLAVSYKYGEPRARSLASELDYELDNKELHQVKIILSKIGVII